MILLTVYDMETVVYVGFFSTSGDMFLLGVITGYADMYKQYRKSLFTGYFNMLTLQLSILNKLGSTTFQKRLKMSIASSNGSIEFCLNCFPQYSDERRDFQFYSPSHQPKSKSKSQRLTNG
uniref:Uncharacterized protein n=1 Tax=Glossina pallidipes TaxID=7398 RepID=A0A1A9Z251_GLOPL